MLTLSRKGWSEAGSFMVAKSNFLGEQWHWCWVLDPMYENWFRKCAENLREGKAGLYSSKAWQKNLRYAKETKKFFVNSKRVGQDFLANNCIIHDFWLSWFLLLSFVTWACYYVIFSLLFTLFVHTDLICSWLLSCNIIFLKIPLINISESRINVFFHTWLYCAGLPLPPLSFFLPCVLWIQVNKPIPSLTTDLHIVMSQISIDKRFSHWLRLHNCMNR